MKKYFFFAVLAVALAGFGMHASIASAQTVTSSPSDNAAMQQELQVAKATLINLEMQEGVIPQGDDQLSSNAAPTVTSSGTGLSASQISAYEDTLATLVGTLSQLNATLSANPNMSTSQLATIETTLSGMQGTVSAMVSSIAANEAANTSPIAMTTPAPAPAATTPAPAGASPAAPVTAANPATTSAPTAAATAATNPVQATAQASSIWSFTKAHWPAIAIIILVIVILAILFWPEKTGTVTPATTTTAGKPAPSVSAAVASAPSSAQTSASTSAPATSSTPKVVTAPADSTKVA